MIHRSLEAARLLSVVCLMAGCNGDDGSGTQTTNASNPTTGDATVGTSTATLSSSASSVEPTAADADSTSAGGHANPCIDYCVKTTICMQVYGPDTVAACTDGCNTTLGGTPPECEDELLARYACAFLQDCDTMVDALTNPDGPCGEEFAVHEACILDNG
jgi:hypothetical protein